MTQKKNFLDLESMVDELVKKAPKKVDKKRLKEILDAVIGTEAYESGIIIAVNTETGLSSLVSSNVSPKDIALGTLLTTYQMFTDSKAGLSKDEALGLMAAALVFLIKQELEPDEVKELFDMLIKKL